jgi:hypothetical protein
MPNEWKNIFIAKENRIIQSWPLWMYYFATEMDDPLRKTIKMLFCPMLFDIRTSLCLEVPSLRPLVLAGMVLTGEKASIRRQSCRIATLFATNLTRTATGSNNKKATVMTLPSLQRLIFVCVRKSVPTSQRTSSFYLTKSQYINNPLSAIIGTNCESRKLQINTLKGQLYRF